MRMNVPNFLTWLRIIAIPLLIAIYYVPEQWMTMAERNMTATVLFIAAAITDWLDGYLARRLNQQSAFGAFLDPVADKLMVAAALMILVELNRVNALIAVVISALREWMAKVGEAKSVAVNYLGKIKTTSQMVAIPMLLYFDPIGGWFQPFRVGTWLIYLAAVMTIASMFYYLKLASPRAFQDP
jgi:CDP-diacylglycerol--glycerol-3-phosphate 3-phosphatidyltransferase/cardiolipin synthase